MNNTEFTDPYGNDDITPIGSNPNIIRDYLKQEHENSQKVVEDSRPTIQPLKYSDEIEAGQILSQHIYEHTNSGVQEVASYSHNTSEQDEARLKEIEQQRQSGYSTYNSPPKSSGIPSIAEIEKPTQEQLAQVHKEAQINSLTQRIRQLTAELGLLEYKSLNAQIALKNAKEQLSELESK